MSAFPFGLDAIVAPESEPAFQDRRDSILDTVKPANIVESILAEELLHAGWEMERVRANAAASPSDDLLSAAANRASRNWHRSLKQLKALQTARASHISRLYEPHERRLGEKCPFADIAKIPQPILIEAGEAQ